MPAQLFTQQRLIPYEKLLQQFRDQGLKLATAESCTGGLLSALLTEIPGSSDVFERGFVTYSNEAKIEMLGVEPALICEYGAVSAQVAIAMALGAKQASLADIAVSVTGIAGPGGGSDEKPVGLVHIAAARNGFEPIHEECRFGDIGRPKVRVRTVDSALGLLRRAITLSSG